MNSINNITHIVHLIEDESIPAQFVYENMNLCAYAFAILAEDDYHISQPQDCNLTDEEIVSLVDNQTASDYYSGAFAWIIQEYFRILRYEERCA